MGKEWVGGPRVEEDPRKARMGWGLLAGRSGPGAVQLRGSAAWQGPGGLSPTWRGAVGVGRRAPSVALLPRPLTTCVWVQGVA